MAPSTAMIQSLLLAAAASSVVAAASANSNSPPSTGQEWVSLHKNAEFQPAAAAEGASPTQQRALRQAQERFLEEQTTSPEQQTSYVDSQETYYDAYAQAWRYVGFYTDCNPAQGDRRLQEGEENACARYLIWAAVSAFHHSVLLACWSWSMLGVSIAVPHIIFVFCLLLDSPTPHHQYIIML